MAGRIKVGGIVADEFARDLANACSIVGYLALRAAYKASTYTNRTYALHDSYGSAVYLNGQLVPNSEKFVERHYQKKADSRGWRGAKDESGAKPKDWETGRQAVRAYLNNPPRLSSKDHITILFVAAQWYAGYVDSNGYKVLDQSVLKNEVNLQFDKYIMPVLKKYGQEKMMPTLRRGLGVDYVAKELKKSRGQ